jgi:hypothetical protein
VKGLKEIKVHKKWINYKYLWDYRKVYEKEVFTRGMFFLING